jgi:SAM-dependent methyltransferase
MSIDTFSYNQRAWDRQVQQGNRWTLPVDGDAIAAARRGDWSVVLTPERPVPRDWFPADLNGLEVLALASAGGQQGPLLAAAGARVTVYDASDKQLDQDRAVAEREGLDLAFVQGDMADLSALDDASFDLVFHPVSNIFVPDVRPVWREAARVLRPSGELLAGFVNPLYFLFDDDALGRGEYVVRYAIPYSDTDQLDSASLDALMAQDEPLCFGHSLTDQIGGQLEAGLAMTGFYEDRWHDKPIDDRIATFIATRASRQ